MTEEQVQAATDEAAVEPPSEADALRAQLADAAFVLLVMVIFIVAGVEYPQAFAIFTWAINGELFLEGGAKWGGRAIKRMKQSDD